MWSHHCRGVPGYATTGNYPLLPTVPGLAGVLTGRPWVMDHGGDITGALEGGAGGPVPPGSCSNARSFYIPGVGVVRQNSVVEMEPGRLLEEGRGKRGRAGRMGRERRAPGGRVGTAQDITLSVDSRPGTHHAGHQAEKEPRVHSAGWSSSSGVLRKNGGGGGGEDPKWTAAGTRNTPISSPTPRALCTG